MNSCAKLGECGRPGRPYPTTNVQERSIAEVSDAPGGLEELVREIAACSDLSEPEIRERLQRQMTGSGNVQADVLTFGVTPHHYDGAMERLYREGDGFIFETLVFARSAQRRHWNVATLARIRRYARRRGKAAEGLRILMFADGCGEDSLFFAEHGLSVDYFDVPGSRTFEFAARRFARHGVAGQRVRVITDLPRSPEGYYDVVVALEVLEHLPDPYAAVRRIASLLRPGGIALASDAFESVTPNFPTHLASNFVFRDTTPMLFCSAGLVYAWTNPDEPDKPMEFEKRALSMTARWWYTLRYGVLRNAFARLVLRGRWREAFAGT